MTPKENIIKQDIVIANSPKRKHGGSSPGKLKGSFLHKAFSSDKTDRLSPFKVRYYYIGAQATYIRILQNKFVNWRRNVLDNR